MIRRVTSYDGALLEEAHPEVHDVLSPDVARTMTAMLEEVITFAPASLQKPLGRPVRRKDGNDPGLHRCLVRGVHAAAHRRCVGGLRRQADFHSGRKKRAHAPRFSIWLEFMQGAVAGKPVMDFPNVVPLEQQAGEHHIKRGHSGYRTHRRRARRPKESRRPDQRRSVTFHPGDLIRGKFSIEAALTYL